MTRKFIMVFVSCMIIFTITMPAYARIEWRVLQKLNLDSRPLDVAVSLDDKWIFLLNDKGQVLVYSKDGVLNDTIDVGKHVNQITLGPRDNLLFLTSKSRKAVEIVELDFIREINTISSPYRGQADAPVIIALFTDFQ